MCRLQVSIQEQEPLQHPTWFIRLLLEASRTREHHGDKSHGVYMFTHPMQTHTHRLMLVSGGVKPELQQHAGTARERRVKWLHTCPDQPKIKNN